MQYTRCGIPLTRNAPDMTGKKKKKNCPSSCRFQPCLSWILKCTVPFFPSPSMSLAYFCLLHVPFCPPCFPAHTVLCYAYLSSANQCPFIQTETKRHIPSDKLARWLMKPCMGERDASGCRWDTDMEHFMMISVQQRKPKSPHTITHFNIQYIENM